VFIEVGWTGSSDGKGVDERVLNAEKRVELHRGKGVCGLGKFCRGLIEHSTFVIRADNKNPHIVLLSGMERPGVFLEDVVPVKIHIIEATALAQLLNQFGRSVSREANPSTKTLLLELTGSIQATPESYRPLQKLP
jgi:hypothetical protein